MIITIDTTDNGTVVSYPSTITSMPIHTMNNNRINCTDAETVTLIGTILAGLRPVEEPVSE